MEKKLILVEGSPIWVELIREQLERDTEKWMIPCHINRLEGFQERISSCLDSIDAAVVDLHFESHFSGLELLRKIKEVFNCPIVVLSSHFELEWMIEANQAGMDNFLDKRYLHELPTIIRHSMNHSPLWSNSSVQLLIENLSRLLHEHHSKVLTHMEKEILSLIYKGYTLSRVQKELCIAERTVKNHVNRILKKLQVASSKEAAKLAYNKKMLNI
ncbi:response regulator transcription factor [Paenibacillus sp. SC116]|uniref:response regulator transcription factor n=1 Tax=Paenibacillus sp. SC116 TaxID=2968986 RepID=UPI00215B30E0|nr:response regulator transcription factor [Paenibacillus sp. SC116]MCR8845882.1 response regulator transcription factor [Paenibacillus sp. SC116]